MVWPGITRNRRGLAVAAAWAPDHIGSGIAGAVIATASAVTLV